MLWILRLFIVLSLTQVLVSAENSNSLALPLVDKMSATLSANIDITNMKTAIKSYIDKTVREIVKMSLNESVDSMSETMETTRDSIEAHLNDSVNSFMESMKAVLNAELRTSQKEMVALDSRVKRIEALLADSERQESTDRISDCSDPALKNKAGIFTVLLDGRTSFNVRCELGGWTVIQRRYDGSTEFYRNWETYENGFGDLDKEFWLGNKYIALLTKDGQHELMINLSITGESRYAHYNSFKVGDASTKYRLTVGGYSGDAGDGMIYHNGQPFSTYDQDNDKRSNINCASHEQLKGAWWFTDCWKSSLNGQYVKEGERYGGIRWWPWKGSWYTLKSSSMMIRRL